MRCSYIASDAMWLYVACVYVCTRWTLSFSLALFFLALHNGIGCAAVAMRSHRLFSRSFFSYMPVTVLFLLRLYPFLFPFSNKRATIFPLCVCALCVFISFCKRTQNNERLWAQTSENRTRTHTRTHQHIYSNFHMPEARRRNLGKNFKPKRREGERERVRAKEAALPSHFFRAVFFGAFSFIFHHVAEDGMYSIQFMILKTYTHISSV